MDSPTQVIQRQLDAYNARDLEAWLATYHEDAEQHELHGGLLARGHAQMRERMQARFADPRLHARLLSRQVMGDFVTDLEIVTRQFPEGLGRMDMLCVYQVRDGRIARASFAFGAVQPA